MRTYYVLAASLEQREAEARDVAPASMARGRVLARLIWYHCPAVMLEALVQEIEDLREVKRG